MIDKLLKILTSITNIILTVEVSVILGAFTIVIPIYIHIRRKKRYESHIKEARKTIEKYQDVCLRVGINPNTDDRDRQTFYVGCENEDKEIEVKIIENNSYIEPLPNIHKCSLLYFGQRFYICKGNVIWDYRNEEEKKSLYAMNAHNIFDINSAYKIAAINILYDATKCKKTTALCWQSFYETHVIKNIITDRASIRKYYECDSDEMKKELIVEKAKKRYLILSKATIKKIWKRVRLSHP